MSELEDGFKIGEVLALVKRRLPVVVGAVLLGLLAGYLVFASAPSQYESTARVQVRPVMLDQFATDGREGTVDIDTEKDLVRSDAVADHVRRELDLPGDNRAILRRIVVATELDSLVLKITFLGDQAAQARDGANAAAEGYLQQRRDAATTTQTSALERLQSEIDEATTALDEANAAVDGAEEGTPAMTAARTQAQFALNELQALQTKEADLSQFDPATVGSLVRQATLPGATTSKMAIGKGVGVFGLIVLAGLAVAWALDRRDGLGGGRRRVEELLPGAVMRVMPGAEGSTASPAEIDTAVDRLAVGLAAGGSPGKVVSVALIGAGMEPPVAMAEELASSLAFAGIPALFVLAGSSDRELRHARTVVSFADLVSSGASLHAPAGLPATAGEATLATGNSISWLRPTGSAEAAGLLRRSVVESLITRAGREGFEAVVFVAASPSRTAAGAAIGQWVSRTAVVIGSDQRSAAIAVATALADADVRVAEVVWT